MNKLFTILIIGIVSLLCLPYNLMSQTVEGEDLYFVNDSLPLVVKEYDKASEEITMDNPITFSPDPNKAVWYAALFPGGGQIYNRKYWKLPLVYGGFMGLTYGYSWNQKYFKGYSNAYRDLVENNPNKSYLDYVRPGFDVEGNRKWLENALKNKKNSYRRNRDLCVISMIGVYLLAMVDAYVDASLYHFDISPNISMRVEPAIISTSPFSGNYSADAYNNPVIINSGFSDNKNVGLQWSIKF